MAARRPTPLKVVQLVVIPLVALLLIVQKPVLAASDPCQPPNILPAAVCDFDDWHGDSPRQVANGWQEYILSGNPDYYRDEHSYFGGGTQTIRSGEPFKAGIWTQMGVSPGAGYRASVAWGAPNLPAEFGRQLGLDPTGGTDPNAPTVIWGPQHFGDGRMLNYISDGPNIDIRARAVGDRMTLFFSVDRPTSSGDGLIFIDAIALYPDESAPDAVDAPTAAPAEQPTVAPPAAPVDDATATPAPAPVMQEFLPITAAQSAPAAESLPNSVVEPPPPSPSDTPAAVPTATALPTQTPQPSPTPTFTATPSPTPTLTPTPSPTWTPWPTVIPPGFITAARTAITAGDVNSLREVPSSPWALATLGAFAFVGALTFGGSLVWLRRR